MNKINVGRVLLGGLLAGLVINVGEFILNAILLQERMKEELSLRNLSEPSPNIIALFLALVFLGGIAIVYLYALIRPRLGPGVKTAICAGLIAWFFVFRFCRIVILRDGNVVIRPHDNWDRLGPG